METVWNVRQSTLCPNFNKSAWPDNLDAFTTILINVVAAWVHSKYHPKRRIATYQGVYSTMETTVQNAYTPFSLKVGFALSETAF
jgi:hypothetical protein